MCCRSEKRVASAERRVVILTKLPSHPLSCTILLGPKRPSVVLRYLRTHTLAHGTVCLCATLCVWKVIGEKLVTQLALLNLDLAVDTFRRPTQPGHHLARAHRHAATRSRHSRAHPSRRRRRSVGRRRPHVQDATLRLVGQPRGGTNSQRHRHRHWRTIATPNAAHHT